MPDRWWPFRLYDADGVCLYVGKTSRTPVFVARSYVTSRGWGDRIDVSRTFYEKDLTKTQAEITVGSWVKKHKPLYPPITTKAKRAKKPPPPVETLADRVLDAQARHRELTKPPSSRSKPPKPPTRKSKPSQPALADRVLDAQARYRAWKAQQG